MAVNFDDLAELKVLHGLVELEIFGSLKTHWLGIITPLGNGKVSLAKLPHLPDSSHLYD